MVFHRTCVHWQVPALKTKLQKFEHQEEISKTVERIKTHHRTRIDRPRSHSSLRKSKTNLSQKIHTSLIYR